MQIPQSAINFICRNTLFLLGLLVFVNTTFAATPTSTTANNAAKQNYSYWPLLPGESLVTLAQSFYPESAQKQKVFIDSTVAINHANTMEISENQVFQDLTLIRIPQLDYAKTPNRPTSKAFRLTNNLDSAEIRVVNTQSDLQKLAAKNKSLDKELKRLETKADDLVGVAKPLREQIINLSNEKSPAEKPAEKPATEAPFSIDQTPLDLTPKPPKPPEAAVENKAALTPPAEAPSQPAPAALDQEAKKPKKFKNLSEISEKNTENVPDIEVNPSPTSFKNIFNAIDKHTIATCAALIWVGVLIYAIYKLALKYRKNKRRKARQALESLNAKNTDFFHSSEEAFKKEVAARMAPPVMTVEEIYSVVEEARVMVAIQRVSEAIDLLKEHLEEYPSQSIHPWIYLLSLFKMENNQAEYEECGKKLNTLFNVLPASWDASETKTNIPNTLEAFPHILETLDEIWPSTKARDYLAWLIKDNRGGERGGFSLAVVEEILFLIDLLNKRLETE